MDGPDGGSAATTVRRPVARIAPSLLAADQGRLEEEALRVVHAGSDWLHIDVMVSTQSPFCLLWS